LRGIELLQGQYLKWLPKEVAMGSIGGGRYDEPEFWFENMSGVGISLG
jgi:hypothetical protein